MSSLDKNIFGKKKLSDIFQEIYNNQKKKEEQISALINELKPLINDIGDATLVVPLIKEYMDLSIKNDEALIKMATIVQRAGLLKMLLLFLLMLGPHPRILQMAVYSLEK